jgi:2-polyprenyl-3-methyl-5-hydroxy-6-metoxy-1,4-benzoquinol methylase
MVEDEKVAAPSSGDLHYFREHEPGLFVPRVDIAHRGDEYNEAGFEVLRDMQARHFWYAGRHRFLHHALRGVLPELRRSHQAPLSAIDLGGGCGGWVNSLRRQTPGAFGELALADSSLHALENAGEFVGTDTLRYQADLMSLPWKDRWDVVFLLDVLEHIPQHQDVLREIHRSLRPGGYLFVTTPALKFFWSYNDELAQHLRRYSRSDFAELAEATGFELSLSRYFMFLLSPLLLLSRLRTPQHHEWTTEETEEYVRKTHRTPVAPLNATLKLIFALETPIGHWIPFPWGTSVLGVFRKPEEA